MKQIPRALTAALLLTAVLAASCNLPSGEKRQATETALVQTVAAGITQTAQAKPSVTPSPSPSSLPTLELPTTQPGVNSSLPTLPPLATSAPAVTACNQASFVADVTIPDGSAITPGAVFTKKWRLQNTGTCTWTSDYTVVYVSGNMTGPSSTKLTTGTVAPGGSVDVSVDITAPTTTNTYYAYFRLKAADGTQFGITQNPSGAFYVQIKVSSLTPTMTLTGQVTPTIGSLSPASASVGGSDFVMTVTGTNYVSGSTVYWGSNALTTTYVSATSLKATVLSARIASAGTVSVTVKNPSGTVSSAATFTITSASNPVPNLNSINPVATNEGNAAFSLTVSGSNFVNGAVVYWNGGALPTTFNSASKLTATVPAGLTGGTYSVAVFNPAPGGGSSGVINFMVNTVSNPAPQLSAINPNTATIGTDTALTVTGANFVSGAVVRINGNDVATSYSSASQLSATIPGSLIPDAATYTITVFNPAPGGGSSGGVDLTVQ